MKKRRTKIKINGVLLVCIVLLVGVVGGTIAYLMVKTDSIVNTFSATHVDVTVTDKVENGVKSNVVITNTGITDAYIRARMVGSWVDGNGVVVKQWVPEEDGIFADLPGENWVEKDGYYYYTVPVAPGQKTAPLFTSYTVTASVEGAQLEMDILVQAIQEKGGAVEQAWGVDPSRLN